MTLDTDEARERETRLVVFQCTPLDAFHALAFLFYRCPEWNALVGERKGKHQHSTSGSCRFFVVFFSSLILLLRHSVLSAARVGGRKTQTKRGVVFSQLKQPGHFFFFKFCFVFGSRWLKRRAHRWLRHENLIAGKEIPKSASLFSLSRRTNVR